MNHLELEQGVAAEGVATSDRYSFHEGRVRHDLEVGSLRIAATRPVEDRSEGPKSAWLRSYLAGHDPQPLIPVGGRLRTADLYCGPGGLANGVRHLCAELGVSVISEFIADQDDEATVVYTANHGSRNRSSSSVKGLIDYNVRKRSTGATFAYPPELLDRKLREALRGVDLVLAGPPCQGHSNLNNSTRRSDPRNELYLTVPAFAVAIGAPVCIIENVQSVLNDSEQVVTTAIQLFESEGYEVTHGVLSAAEMGWPQTRRRHFLVARKDRVPIPLDEVKELLRDEPRSLWWAIGHLEDEVGDEPMRQVSVLSAENQARLAWLFKNEEDELALAERPASHRGGTTYTAVYGRLKKDLPAPTITTGFMSPGRGRFTHPTRRRVLTPREAARIQGFPDTYRFVTDPARPPARFKLAKWIGDAVPMPLGYAAALAAFGNGLPEQGDQSADDER